jgi:hypothetical protein
MSYPRGGVVGNNWAEGLLSQLQRSLGLDLGLDLRSDLGRDLGGTLRVVADHAGELVESILSVVGDWTEEAATWADGTVVVGSLPAAGGYRRGYAVGLDLAEAVALADLIDATAAGWPAAGDTTSTNPAVSAALEDLLGSGWADRLAGDRRLVLGLAAALRDVLDATANAA